MKVLTEIQQTIPIFSFVLIVMRWAEAGILENGLCPDSGFVLLCIYQVSASKFWKFFFLIFNFFF